MHAVCNSRSTRRAHRKDMLPVTSSTQTVNTFLTLFVNKVLHKPHFMGETVWCSEWWLCSRPGLVWFGPQWECVVFLRPWLMERKAMRSPGRAIQLLSLYSSAQVLPGSSTWGSSQPSVPQLNPRLAESSEQNGCRRAGSCFSAGPGCWDLLGWSDQVSGWIPAMLALSNSCHLPHW
jgi:hypothetical protein